MRRLFLSLALILALSVPANADTIMDYALITPLLTDQTWMVDDPGGTPIEARATLQSIADLFWTDLAAGDIPDISATYLTLSQIGAAYDTEAELNALFAAKESSTSNNFDPDRLAGDTTDNNLIDEAVIDSAIARDSELHAAVTLAAGTNGVALSTQELSVESKLEILADNSGSPNFNGVTPTFLSTVLGVASTTSGVLDFKNATNNYTLGVKPGATSQDWDITLPTAPPAGNDYAVVMSTGGVISYIDSATFGGTPALNTVGNAADAWAVNSGTYVHVITMGTSGEWRWGVDASNYISVINDAGVMRLKPVGTSTIDTGTITVSTDSIHAQTGTTADDDMYLAAYDVDDTAYKNMLILKAANTVYGYLGNATNGLQWTEDGAVTFVGTGGIVPLPTAADGGAIGSATKEYSDVYLADGAVIYFGADQDVTLTHNADAGVTLNLDLTIAGSDLTLGAAGVKLTGDGDGAITLLGLGNGSDEDLTINLDDVSNEIGISSSTGVDNINLGAIRVETTGDVTGGVLTTSKAAGYTIGTDDPREAYGGTVYVTSAATIVAPAIADGMSFTVITVGAIAVVLDVNASDLAYLDGTALADGDSMTNTSTTGDMIYCQYYSAAGWWCVSGSPDGDHWTDTN